MSRDCLLSIVGNLEIQEVILPLEVVIYKLCLALIVFALECAWPKTELLFLILSRIFFLVKLFKSKYVELEVNHEYTIFTLFFQ